MKIVIRAMTRKEAKINPAAFLEQVIRKQASAKKNAWERDYKNNRISQQTLDEYRSSGAI